jgi:hypothetical protein
MQLQKYLPALFVLALVAVLHMLGMYHNLYYIFAYYDVPMHFLGGLWLGLSAVWASVVIFHMVPVSFFKMGLWVLSFTIFGAIVWELFEFHAGLTYVNMVTSAGLGYWADTSKDIAMGGLGGVVAWMYGIYKYRKN